MILHSPARAALAMLAALLVPEAALAAADPTSAVLPWGDALAAAAQGAGSAVVPVAAAAATAALARVAGPLRLLVANTLVERLVRNVGDYALNAVAGAVKGRTLTVPLGSAVIAAAVQRAADQAPAWLLREAGGLEGLAEKVFRSLSLEAAADAANTLRPALDAARRGGAPAS
ncbi:hypothetical protein [Methylobacterium durans]|uniref:DUF4197 domain-containing protein n=1 Tax=Methylobacterium durans TaxID=2202825 RepID=A0A2U8W522_9HYPH|nr:hypothetical protein [Methylobacterium durans]AWN41205.1 hypothetical protein DK389_12565 [Methylobacterium durans]